MRTNYSYNSEYSKIEIVLMLVTEFILHNYKLYFIVKNNTKTNKRTIPQLIAIGICESW